MGYYPHFILPMRSSRGFASTATNWTPCSDSLSLARQYLAWRDGPRGFRPASTCRVLLRCQTRRFPFRLRDFHPLWSNIPGMVQLGSAVIYLVLHPPPEVSGWFRLVRFRSPLL